MRMMLLGLAAPIAAIAIPAAPAAAFDPAAPQFTSAASVTVHRGGPSRSGAEFRGDWRDGDRDRRDRRRDRRDRRDDRDFDGVLFLDREWQGDSAWRANSYNDWWHERPHRSYPRWVRSNSDCERMWQGGGVWRCSW